VEERAVIPLVTVPTIYEVPLILEEEGLGDFIVDRLSLPASSPDLREWREMVERIKAPKPHVRIAVVGKYVALLDAYLSVREALSHAGVYHGRTVDIDWINAEDLEKGDVDARLQGAAGIVVPGGFGSRGIAGKIAACRFAREHKIPYLGLCLGMQVMVIELARHALKSDEPNSTEFDPETPYPVIDLLPEQREKEDKGGTMRLGLYPCFLVPGTKAAAAYGQPLIYDRHRHRYELNNEYRKLLSDAGMIFSGLSPDGRLVEIAEMRDHPWMVGCQFHPELRSRPNRPHPLFRDFIAAAMSVLPAADQRPVAAERALA